MLSKTILREGMTVESKKQNTDELLTIEKDAQIKVVVNNADEINEDAIIIGSVFHNMKNMHHIFIWVIILCVLIGFLIPLLLYQFRNEPAVASSIVVKNYSEEEDQYTIKSPSVIRKALIISGLSETIIPEDVIGNLLIEKIDDENQEIILSKDADDIRQNKDADNLRQKQSDKETNQVKYVVSLSNGFSNMSQANMNKKKIFLTEEKLQSLLDNILFAYNETLIKEKHRIVLPNDELADIDKTIEKMNFRESIISINNIAENLYDYCVKQPNDILEYRSSKNGLSLRDWIGVLQTFSNLDLDTFNVHINVVGFSIDPTLETDSLQNELQRAQTELSQINDRISNNQIVLANYKVEDIYYISQQNGTSQIPGNVSEEYDNLVLQQAKLLSEATSLKTEIAGYEASIASIAQETNPGSVESVISERDTLIEVLRRIYTGISEHMEETAEYYSERQIIDYSYPEVSIERLLSYAGKKMLVGAFAGMFIACFIWFIAGLIPEFRHERKKIQ